MTTAIEDKMYELITKDENFNFAYDLSEHFESIKERLIKEFWDTLVLKFRKELLDYKVKEDNAYETHLDISSKSFTKVSFYVGVYESKLEYGISISHNGTKKKFRELEDIFSDIFEGYDPEVHNKVSWFFEYGEEEFDSLFVLKKLLPENRDELINKYIHDFKKMIESKHEVFLEFEGVSI